jgi:hypothetical protein
MPQTLSLKTKVNYWWDVYDSLLSSRPLRECLGLNRKWDETTHRYIDWDMNEDTIECMQFDKWWEKHHSLFLDADFPVRKIMSDHLVRNPDNLYLSINMKWSTRTKILKEIRSYLCLKAQSIKRKKGQTRSHGEFRFTAGVEIRPGAYDEYIRFLKEVFAPNCKKRPIALRNIAKVRFKGEKVLPSLHLKGDDKSANAYMSVYRYRKKVISLCRAVARGEFPGSDK